MFHFINFYMDLKEIAALGYKEIHELIGPLLVSEVLHNVSNMNHISMCCCWLDVDSHDI